MKFPVLEARLSSRGRLVSESSSRSTLSVLQLLAGFAGAISDGAALFEAKVRSACSRPLRDRNCRRAKRALSGRCRRTRGNLARDEECNIFKKK